jgi:nitrite reductase/ring-hydroxylating ferredoxin subunit
MSNQEAVHFDLCNQTDLENESMKEIEFELEANKKVKVLLIKHNNIFYCTGPKCTHYGVPLVKGVLNNGRVRCFAHGACFDITTGDIEDYPGMLFKLETSLKPI